MVVGLLLLAAVFTVAFIALRVPARRLLRPLPASLTVVRVGFNDLPGWQRADPRAALRAFAKSCNVLLKKLGAASLGGAGYAGTAGDWRAVCGSLPLNSSSADSARRFIEAKFQPLELIPVSGSPALFTGYYEPELSASRTRHGPYQVPIYGPPDTLVTIDLGAFRPEWEGQHLYGCLSERRLLPCASRAEIDAKGLPNAAVPFYAQDTVAVFFLHIQGSGRVRLEDGSTVRVVYAGQNGHRYKPIGRTLIEHGWLDREHMSMQAIRGWLKAHPAQARKVMESDPSFVFFREQPLNHPDEGANGSEGVPLTAGASLALDPRVHPLGVPVYVAARRPDAHPNRPDRAFNQLLIAQDTGGAIRGAGRGDVYWGWGAEAESIAGRMKSTGRFFVLVPKAVAARIRGRRELPTS
jgi:membrane-bound lytic murein transglycosylase A